MALFVNTKKVLQVYLFMYVTSNIVSSFYGGYVNLKVEEENLEKGRGKCMSFCCPFQ